MRVSAPGGGSGGGGGTVTSVGLSMPVIFSVAGSPVTTSGTFIVTAVCAQGDLVYGSLTNVFGTLPIGSSGQVLTVAAGLPSWQAAPVTSVFGRTGAVVAVAGDYGPTLGGTGQTAVAAGDLLYGSAANTWSRLAAGANGRVLTVVAGLPSWEPATSGGTVTSVALAAPSIFSVSGSPVTTSGTLTLTAACAKGDIIYGSATNTYAKLGIGSTGAVLIVSAGGVPSWGVVTETWGGTNQTTYATGQILYASATNTLSKLNIGGAGIPLVSNGTTPAWSVLSEAGGGTNQTTYTAGQILYASATNTLSKLNVGGNGTVLTVVAGLPAWTAAPGTGTVTSVALSAPSIFSVSGSPVTTSGTLTLTASCATGDLIYGSAANTYSKLAIGSTGQVLTVAGGVPSWAAVVCPATAFVTLTDGATITVTASSFPTGQMGIGKVTLGGNRTLSFSGGTAGQRIELWIKQDATGSRTLAYDSSCAFSTTVPSPTLTTTANAKDKQSWEYDDVAGKWNLMAFVAGFAA